MSLVDGSSFGKHRSGRDVTDDCNVYRLAREEQGGNWLYSIDGLAPLEIYN